MTTTSSTPHRFFGAMVLMGGNLALGCGGQSLDRERASGGSGATGGDGSGATGGSMSEATGGSSGTTGSGDTGGTSGDTSTGANGGTTSSGGSSSVTGGAAGSSAGVTSSGGTGTSTGGGPAAGGAMPAGGTTSITPGCSTDQLSCGVPECSFDGNGYQLPSNCKCDSSKPLSGSECASGWRVCREASTNAEGDPLPVPFDCVCASDPTSCDNSCQQAFPEGDGHICTDPVATKLLPSDPVLPSDLLCGCSFVLLK